MYGNIDMERTAILLKELFDGSGYTVKDIQKILHLSCPQPIYRWFRGSILPSVDHFCQPEGFDAYGYPSELFKLDMERLGIAAKREPAKVIDFAQYIENNRGTND